MLLLLFGIGVPGQGADALDQWEIVARPPIELRGLAYKDGVFVGVGIGTNIVVSTNGGAGWFVVPIPLTNYVGGLAVTEGAGQFVAVGWRGGIVTSADGLQWTLQQGGAQTQFEEYWAVTHGGAGFVAVGFESHANGPAIAANSWDGVHWEKYTLPFITTPRNVAYGNGVYVAAGAPVSLVSSNGRDWTAIPSVTAQGVAFGGGQFIATLLTTGFRSTNGRDWTPFPLPALAGHQNYYTASYANGTFLAGGFCDACPNSNRPSLLATSSDGSQWTSRLFGADANIGPIRDIIFAEDRFYLADSWQKIWRSDPVPRTANQRKVVTFDDLSPGPEAPLIPVGYEGLIWGCRVLDAFRPVTSPGIRNGMVSPNNVASGSLIWIMTNSFDLHSLYLTASFADDAQIRVQGFAGPTVTHTNNGSANRPTLTSWRQAYENTFSVNPNTPTLVQLDYLGVDQVRFEASSDFVMDNVAVTVHEMPKTPARVDLGLVRVSSIGHTFVLDPRPIGNDIRRNQVTDLLIDQQQSSGGGGVLSAVTVDWDSQDQFSLTIAAPPGMKFLVRPPAAEGGSIFRGFLWWQTPDGGGSSLLGPVVASFAGVEGRPPVYSSLDAAALSDVHGWFGAINFISARFTNEFAFTSITITGTVVPQHTGLGSRNFTPHPGCQLAVSYTTQEPNDPGRFLSIVPQSPGPRLRITGTSPEGAELFVQGQAGRTTIIEASADLSHWTPIRTNVMPFTLCPICPFVIVTDAAANGRSPRFYRAYEIP